MRRLWGLRRRVSFTLKAKREIRMASGHRARVKEGSSQRNLRYILGSFYYGTVTCLSFYCQEGASPLIGEKYAAAGSRECKPREGPLSPRSSAERHRQAWDLLKIPHVQAVHLTVEHTLSFHLYFFPRHKGRKEGHSFPWNGKGGENDSRWQMLWGCKEKVNTEKEGEPRGTRSIPSWINADSCSGSRLAKKKAFEVSSFVSFLCISPQSIGVAA